MLHFSYFSLNCYSKVKAGLSIEHPLPGSKADSSAILLLTVVVKVEDLAALTVKAAPNVIPLVRLSAVGGFQSQSLQLSSASSSVDAVDK